MKATLILVVSSILGILAGTAKDQSEYKKAVAAAKAANQPIPDFDWAQYINHVTPFLMAALGGGGAVAMSQS